MKNSIGKTAHIKPDIDSIHAGGWGVIVTIDEDGYYHIAMYGDQNDCVIFSRGEFVIHRKG